VAEAAVVALQQLVVGLEGGVPALSWCVCVCDDQHVKTKDVQLQSSGASQMVCASMASCNMGGRLYMHTTC
jgi:hypothetical protein